MNACSIPVVAMGVVAAGRPLALVAGLRLDGCRRNPHGIELDPRGIGGGGHSGVTVEQANFLTLDPRAHPSFDAGGNPLHRAEWIDRLGRTRASSPFFPLEPADQANASPWACCRETWRWPSSAGPGYMHILHPQPALSARGGRLGFVVPNGWLATWPMATL